jgi:hypothetical protein
MWTTSAGTLLTTIPPPAQFAVHLEARYEHGHGNDGQTGDVGRDTQLLRR